MDTCRQEIYVRPATTADAPAWDAFVLKHSLATPYHCWAWKLALEEGYKLKTTYRCAQDKKGDIVGIMPVAEVRSILGKKALSSLPYCDRGEPLALNDNVFQCLLDDAKGVMAHEIRGTTHDDNPKRVDSSTLREGQKVRLLLDLPNNSQELMAGFKSKHRSQIRKAEKNGLTATVGSGGDRITGFYDVFTRNMRDLGSPTHSRQWFESIVSSYGNDALIGLVEYEGQTIGAGIVLISGTRAAIPWASTLRPYNRLAPNMLLYWKLLEAVTDRGCTQFDFGRSSFGEGTYRFKTQWGARPVPLHWYTAGSDNTEEERLPSPHESPPSINRLRVLVEHIWRRLPLSLTVLIGSRLRPRISL